jgi:hypothetical protein
MSRTIVASDLHGRLQLLENILYHSNFDEGVDTLVIAGDTCDIGLRTMAIHKRLSEIPGTIELVGNHEIAHMCSIDIQPYDKGLDPDYGKFIGIGITNGYFRLAHSIDNILITHAGLSHWYFTKGAKSWNLELGKHNESPSLQSLFGDPSAKQVEEYLNDYLYNLVEVNEEFMMLNIKPDPLWLNRDMPLWFRPYDMTEQDMFYSGFRQIAGHTPFVFFGKKKQKKILDSGATMIDPYNKKYWDEQYYCLYAVIEDGKITVVNSCEDDEL